MNKYYLFYRYRLSDVMRALSEHSAQEERADYKVDTTKKYTYQDYLKLPEEPGYRYEILEGDLVKDPSPNVPNVMHQRVYRRLIRVLEDYFSDYDIYTFSLNSRYIRKRAENYNVQGLAADIIFKIYGRSHEFVLLPWSFNF